jgi:peroxiredoxin family protein
LGDTDAKRMSIIVTKSALDTAYPPFLLAATAASMGFEVTMFFTFQGLTLLRKELDLHVDWTAEMAAQIPALAAQFQAQAKGDGQGVTAAVKGLLDRKDVPSIDDLRELAQEAGVRMIACQMTLDLFDYARDDLIEGLDYAGAATYIDAAAGCSINLYT